MMTNFENVESIDNNSWFNNAPSFDCQELTGLNLLNLLLYTVLLYHKTVNNILLRIRGPVSQARIKCLVGPSVFVIFSEQNKTIEVPLPSNCVS